MSNTATRDELTGTIHTAEVETIAAGGAGVARLDGRAVFIPRTVPGDRVSFRILADKGRFLRGELEEITRAGADRRDPPCPDWAECGGCPLQQMTPGGQTEAKSQIFLDALSRIGKIETLVQPQLLGDIAFEFAYRMRARFQIQGDAIGFFAPGTRDLIPVNSCLLTEEPVSAAFGDIRQLLQEEPAARGIESVEITSLDEDPDLGAGLLIYPIGTRDRGKGTLSGRTSRAWRSFSRSSGRPLAVAGERSPEEASQWTARYELDTPAGGPLSLRVSPESFLQANRPVNRLLVQAVTEGAALPEDGRAVDLYCGAGNFSIPLAKIAGRVVGVESSPFAIRDAEANARDAGLDNLRFIQGESGRIEADEILDALGGGTPDLVLLDPPRRGALETVPLIMRLMPGRIIYVSCNPATFARDARELTEGGYRMETALIAPMFPNTAHVESATWWRRENAPAPG